jgi:hypothetical protein
MPITAPPPCSTRMKPYLDSAPSNPDNHDNSQDEREHRCKPLCQSDIDLRRDPVIQQERTGGFVMESCSVKATRVGRAWPQRYVDHSQPLMINAIRCQLFNLRSVCFAALPAIPPLTGACKIPLRALTVRLGGVVFPGLLPWGQL